MARLGRFFIPGTPLYVLQRGNDNREVFSTPGEYARFREWLHEGAAANGCAIHAYVLMPNHVCLLTTPRHERSLPKTMQSLGRRYVHHFNAAHGRSGTLWEGRYRATLIEAHAYLLDCMRFIEGEPVRMELAAHPAEYEWSSYRANALGDYDALVKAHELYTGLGATPSLRQQAYRHLFDRGLSEEFVALLHAATTGGWPLGSDQFKQDVARALGRRVAPLLRGRPPRHNAR